MRTVAVLGAGTMGAQIAAHLANAGVSVWLLDLSEQVARDLLEKARKLKPDPFFVASNAARIQTGGFDTHLQVLKQCDWVIEAVIERLDIKRDLLAKVEANIGPATIVSSNTSGIPITLIAEGRSESFRKRWLGTHFFNPPRYLRLLEVIPTADTDPAVVARIADFGDRHLGKGVVIAKDTPNFIANHLGMFGMARVFQAVADGSYTVEEVDAITGPALGRPKSATFRTADIAGVDVLWHVTRNLGERVSPEVRQQFELIPLVDEMVKRGWTGEKAGQGFYKRLKGAEGKSEILALDLGTLEYRPQQKAKFPSIEAGKSVEDTAARIKSIFLADDKAGAFLRATLAPTLLYAAKVALDIAHSIDDVDRAMQWGFGWELGPFATWDAIGVKEVLAAMPAAEVPPLVQQVLDRGANRFRDGGVPPQAPALALLSTSKAARGTVKKNAGASLVDLGDGVLCLEFHSKMNAIGGDTLAMIDAGVKEAEKNFQAMVVGNDATNFSVGANLMLLLLEAQEGNWDDLDLMIRAFQKGTMTLKYAGVPVVVAPAGLALGGGCEVSLHGARIQAAAETYMGLVEVGVGLIPAGGGTKEMTARAVDHVTSLSTDLLPLVQPVFEALAFGTVATSAEHARGMGFLRPGDRVSMHRDRIIADARDLALTLARGGYQAPLVRSRIAVGGDAVLAPLKLGVHLAWRGGRISDHDKLVGTRLATIIAGGASPHPRFITEQQLLDLEREAFLSLCGERKTLERIQHTLKTGKPLRN